MANFYQRFILEFTSITKPLIDLTKEDHAFQWGAVEQDTFSMLKKMFITTLILAYPDPHSPLHVETNTLTIAIGAAFSMKCGDGGWQLCAYYSHALLDSELNWSVYNKELYTILKAFKQWQH